jgi:hypothetical protein
MGWVRTVVCGGVLLGLYVCVHGEAMVGYILFLAFWAVFAVVYLSRDSTQDAEKTQQCDLW